jgi:ubiquinone biosynthesis protein
MALSLKPQQLRRYRDIIRLLVRYGRSDAVRSAVLDLEPDEPAPEGGAQEGDSTDLAADLERMGPTFIKLGQLLSTRADLFPVSYMDALSRLQDEVEPFDPGEAEELVQEELGVRISKAFHVFEREPMAAASLGQVHYAELRDGRPVAVKLQRPGVRERVAEDLEALGEVARLLDERSEWGQRYDFQGIIGEFEKSLADELDYLQEAKNLDLVGRNLQRHRRLVVPRPVADYTTSKVLTMDYVVGRKITSLSPLARLDFDGGPLAEELFEAYLQQILVDGLFHADPHPGNLFLTDDHRVALLDLGMVGRVSPSIQDTLLRMLLAISEGEGEQVAELAIGLGDVGPDFDEPGFRAATLDLVARHQDATVQEIEMGRIVISVTRNASRFGIRVPSTLTLLGKTLLNLDQVGRILDPEFDPNAAIQVHAADIFRRRMLKAASPGNIFRTAMEMNEMVQRLPGRLNKVLDRISRNEVELKVNAFDEVHLMEGVQKIANRITAGLVLAALIVGAALLVQVDTDFTILGYPGLAILLFLGAVAGGVVLMVDIFLHDEKSEKRKKTGRGGR